HQPAAAAADRGGGARLQAHLGGGGQGRAGDVLGDAVSGSGASSINVQGEAQKKLDVLSYEILLEANDWCGHLAACASEEMEHCTPIPDAYPRGNYLLLFDPLDGSSNIDVN